MKTRLIRIGNSRGVRLRKAMIDEAGLPEEVARQLRDRNGDALLDDITATS